MLLYKDEFLKKGVVVIFGGSRKMIKENNVQKIVSKRVKNKQFFKFSNGDGMQNNRLNAVYC